MPTNRKQEDNSPCTDDAVLGGEALPQPLSGVVLGGIEGVKRRLAAAAVKQRLAALYDALNYGEAGLELVLEALQDESPHVQSAAYFLLKDSDFPKANNCLSNYLPWFEFDVVTNAFGLYDMHGNVFEWCRDSWHDNYEGAPTDGSAWENDNDNRLRLLRGGSWFCYPVTCRSAFRNYSLPSDLHGLTFSFRVACGAA